MRTALFVLMTLHLLTSTARAQDAVTSSAAQADSAAESVSELPGNDVVEALFPSEEEKKRVASAPEKDVAACTLTPDSELCKVVAKVCSSDTPEALPEKCQSWVPPTEPDRSRKGRGLGGGPTGSVTAPPELLESLRKCLQENSCRTLADFRQQDNEGYIDLRLWCTKEAHRSVRRQPGVDRVCSAIKKHEHQVDVAETAVLWELQRALGKLKAAKALQARAMATEKYFSAQEESIRKAAEKQKELQRNVNQDTQALADAQAAYDAAKDPGEKEKARQARNAASQKLEASRKQLREFEKLNSALLKAHKIVEAAKKTIEEQAAAIKAASDEEQRAREQLKETPNNGLVALMAVDRFDLRRFEQTLSRPIPRCDGFGLILPLVSARYLHGGRYDMKGPVEAGIGGGYYWDVTCSEKATFGFQAFLFSEGVDPSNKFHMAAGFGASLSAYEYFHFGLGIGYDLFRYERPTPDADFAASGLITKRPVAPGNLMTLFTFSIRSTSETQETKKEQAPEEETP
jgi:hypothetical protein